MQPSAAAADSCKTLVVTLHPPGPQAENPNSRIKPDQLGEFAQKFVRATVERYDGDGINDAPGSPVVTYWELYNEPDASIYVLGDDWHKGWGSTGAEYAEMLSVAYEAIKQANPKARRVITSAASPTTSSSIRAATSSRFLDDVLLVGGRRYFRHHEHPFLSGQLLDRRDESRLPGKRHLFRPWRGGKVAYVQQKLTQNTG